MSVAIRLSRALTIPSICWFRPSPDSGVGVTDSVGLGVAFGSSVGVGETVTDGSIEGEMDGTTLGVMLGFLFFFPISDLAAALTVFPPSCFLATHETNCP